MAKLPEDLIYYLRNTRLGRSQRAAIRELVLLQDDSRLSAAEYARRYARRSARISRALELQR